ncbi:FliH/SctL family protein [Natronincola peptidivorans]|nr:FliH/SctL family protein [Natronincola peptidivorans]
MDIKIGHKKELQYISENIVKNTQQPIDEISSEEIEKSNEIARLKARKILEDAEQERNQLLENARKEAELIIEEAYEDSKSVLEKAKKDGYNDGIQLGKRQGYQEYQDLLDEAMAMKKDIYKTKKRLAKEIEKEMIDLVIYSIKKVIDYELQENHQVLLNLISKGLEKCTFTETLIIRVSNEDYDVLESYKNKIYMMTEGIDDLQIKKDAALKKGSIIIETLSGKIDASIDIQINQIEVLFKELLREEGFHEGNSTT